MAKRLLVMGAGGHGRAVADLAAECGWTVAGFTDRVTGASILGRDEDLTALAAAGAMDAAVVGVGNAALDRRAALFQLLKASGIVVATLVHPRAVLSRSCRLGEGVVVFAGGVLGSSVEVGDNAVVYSGVIAEHDGRIGAHAYLSPGVVLCGGVTIEAHGVPVLGARQLVDASALPPTVTVHYYDEEAYAVDSRELESLTQRLVTGWWQAASDEPDLSYRDVWLPDLLTVGKRLRVRLEVVERLGIIDRVLGEVKADQLRLLSGASMTEQVARLLAKARGLGVRSVSRSLWPQLAAGAYAALFPREDRIN